MFVLVILLRLIDKLKAKDVVYQYFSSHIKPKHVQLAQADKTVETTIVNGLNGCR